MALIDAIILCLILLLISSAIWTLRKNQIEQDKNIVMLLDKQNKIMKEVNEIYSYHSEKIVKLENSMLINDWGRVNVTIRELIHSETDYEFKSLREDIQNFGKSLLSEEFIDKVIERINRKQLV